jgi:hypothetical protein
LLPEELNACKPIFWQLTEPVGQVIRFILE